MNGPTYLSGPMSGLPDYNFPAFRAAAERLRALGMEVVSPAEMDEADSVAPGERSWEWYLQRDLIALLGGCKSVAVLPGWQDSRGARLEVHVARALGMPVVDAETLAPVAETTLPVGSAARKGVPLARGVLDYFPAALAEVARLSQAGNDKHNPGEPLHHARGKSMDHADCIMRHLVDRGSVDPEDGFLHDVKVAWRALALLQEQLEARGAPMARGARETVAETYAELAAG